MVQSSLQWKLYKLLLLVYMNNLQPLFGAILDDAKRDQKIQFWVHITTFIIAVSTIFLNGKGLYVACALMGISELSAWYVKFSSNVKKDLGQEILRTNMLKNAFGTQSHLSIAYLTSRIPKKAWSEAKKHENDEYYDNSNIHNGKENLVKILQESCFWSQHLYGICSKNSFIKVAVFIATIFFLGISFSVFIDHDQAFSGPRIFILLVALLPLWNELDNAIICHFSSSKLRDVDQRLEKLDIKNEAEIFALYADYNVVTAKAPLIPQKVYESEKDLLNRLWKDRASGT